MTTSRWGIHAANYKWWSLGVTSIGSFMSILDTSIVNIALPKMMAVFSATTDQAQWILTAYMLTMGVLQPVTGYLCDTYGTRRMYLLSLALFTLGSALCGVAWSNDTMILFRVIQAIGGGFIIPVTMTIVYHGFAPAERNMAMGIWGISAMVAPSVGPTLSGYLVDYWDWRFIFTINIPIGVIGYLAAMVVLKETTLIRGKSFDFWGVTTAALGLFCLLLALSKGVEEGWGSTYIMTLFYVAIASLSLFVAVELRHENPILDLTLFRDWNFALSSVVTFINTIVLFGSIFLVPLFMENLQGYDAMDTGILLFPSAMVAGLTMPIAGKLADRFGAKPLVVLGGIFLGLSTVPLQVIDLDTGYHYVMAVQTLRGLGLGLAMMTVTVLGMSTVPLSKVSRASALNNTLRQISGSLGIAVLSTVLQNRQIVHQARIAENMNINSLATTKFVNYGEKLFGHLGNIPALAHKKAMILLDGVVRRQSTVFAFDDAFLVMGAICAVGVVAAVLLKPAKEGAKPAVVAME